MRLHPVSRLLPLLALLGGVQACAPAPAPVMYDGSVAAGPDRRIIGAVNFDFDSYRIRPDSYVLLNNIAVALNDPALAGLRFEVNGHTDVVGRLGYNISLSGTATAAQAAVTTAERRPPASSPKASPSP